MNKLKKHIENLENSIDSLLDHNQCLCAEIKKLEDLNIRNIEEINRLNEQRLFDLCLF